MGKTAIRKTSSSQLDNGAITSSDYIVDLNGENRAQFNLKLHQISSDGQTELQHGPRPDSLKNSQPTQHTMAENTSTPAQASPETLKPKSTAADSSFSSASRH
ncbi:MAG: hypothetical protein U0176_20970 [Bacteroidia bacterium]